MLVLLASGRASVENWFDAAQMWKCTTLLQFLLLYYAVCTGRVEPWSEVRGAKTFGSVKAAYVLRWICWTEASRTLCALVVMAVWLEQTCFVRSGAACLRSLCPLVCLQCLIRVRTIYQSLSYGCSICLCAHGFEPSVNLYPVLLMVYHFSSITYYYFTSPTSWNSLPDNLKNVNLFLQTFKRHLKTFFFSSY